MRRPEWALPVEGAARMGIPELPAAVHDVQPGLPEPYLQPRSADEGRGRGELGGGHAITGMASMTGRATATAERPQASDGCSAPLSWRWMAATAPSVTALTRLISWISVSVATPHAGWAARLFSFPNPVNEISARLVAGGVVLLAVAAIVSGEPWLVALIAYGFVARVLTGPTLSPLGQLVTRVITPRLRVEAKYVAGPPKRFAQAIGAVLTVSAAVLAVGFGEQTAADVLLVLVIVAATLESVFALCIGCQIFALLMRAGVIPEEVCERCNDIWSSAPAPANRA